VILVDLLFIVWLYRRSVDWLKFLLVLLVVVSGVLVVHLVLRTWAAFSLEYWVDRNAVTVRWANTRQLIPLHDVQRVIQGGVESLGGSGWLQWPAPYVGSHSRALGLLNITTLATRPLHECLLLDTGYAVFALSPQDGEAFLGAVQRRYRLGPVTPIQASKVRATLFDRLFGHDATGAVLVGLGLAGALALFGLLMLNFPDLPDVLAFHYNSDGLPDVVRGKGALFLLPSIGLLAWLTNSFWGAWMALHEQRTGAYMLWGGTLVVQIFSFLALSSLMY
jgi:hypothetical protein